jgi:hypothetical protein
MNKELDNLDNFMKGLAAASQLLYLARNKGCFIECVCLSATIIDASLRIGIILKHQLDNRTDSILDELLFQSEDDKIISERKVYKKALINGVIDQLIFDKLEKLYKQRNKVIHRYVISEITTDKVLNVAKDYKYLMDLIKKKLDELEMRQIKEGIGMTKIGREVPIEVRLNQKIMINEMIRKKHGNDLLDERLKQSDK